MIPVLLYTAIFFGGIPLSFTIISSIFFLRKHRILAPIALVLALFQAVCVIVLVADPVAELIIFWLFAIILPIVLALAGSIWTILRTKIGLERGYGIGFSVLGSALTGGQVAFFIIAIWGTI